MSEKERLDFDWREKKSDEKGSEKEIDEKVLKQPFDAAYAYLREHLGPQFTD